MHFLTPDRLSVRPMSREILAAIGRKRFKNHRGLFQVDCHFHWDNLIRESSSWDACSFATSLNWYHVQEKCGGLSTQWRSRRFQSVCGDGCAMSRPAHTTSMASLQPGEIPAGLLNPEHKVERGGVQVVFGKHVSFDVYKAAVAGHVQVMEEVWNERKLLHLLESGSFPASKL